MIVPSMSNNEILKEMLKDLREVKEHFGKHYKTCFKRQVLQAAKFPFIKHICFIASIADIMKSVCLPVSSFSRFNIYEIFVSSA